MPGRYAVYRIPTAALASDSEKRHFVWIYEPGTQLVRKRIVAIGPAEGKGISVRAGLEPGDLIVASGAGHLQEGMKVRMLGQPLSDP